MNKRTRWIVAVTVALAALCGASAATIWVAPTGFDGPGCGAMQSAPCLTIGRGTAQAAPGDIVRVMAGTYHECIGTTQPIDNFSVVADAFETSGDRSTTVIDGTGICDGTGSVFRPTVALGDGATLRGFTVRGGGDSGVRGIGSVVITRNIITGNTGDLAGFGGGIQAYSSYQYLSSAPLQVEYNDVISNSAPRGGGGIYVLSKSRANQLRPVSVKGNVVRNNTTSEGRAMGAGILVRTVGLAGGTIPVVVTQNTIEGNSNLVVGLPEAAYGGGIAVAAYERGTHTIDITENTITGNHSGGLGGGISMFTDGASGGLLHITASGNTVEGNSSGDSAHLDGYGGGIWCETFGFGTETIDITGNTVRSNTASPRDGGGIAAWAYPAVSTTGSQHVSVVSNTVTGNDAEHAGGGVQVFLIGADLPSTAVAELTANDNIITNNTASGGDGHGGGLYAIQESSRTNAPGLVLSVERNTITGNSAALAGGGAVLWIDANADPFLDGNQSATTASVRFAHNLVAGNHAIDSVSHTAVGGGILTLLEAAGTGTATLQLDFDTIIDNDADQGNGGIEIESETRYDVLDQSNGTAVMQISNSIVSNNVGIGVGGPVPGDPGALTVGGTGNLDVTAFSFNDVFGNNPGGDYDDWFGARTGSLGNISADPFVDAQGVPSPCSPTIDAGDPAADFSLEPEPNGQRANMGHLGGTAGAISAAGCDDGDACTTDSCDSAGECTHTPVQCDDGNRCTTDSCDSATGCVQTAVTCDDGDSSTTDSCDPAGGCVHTAGAGIFFSTASAQFLDGFTARDGDIVRRLGSVGSTSIVASIPSPLGVDALDVRSDGTALFSVRNSGGLHYPGGFIAARAENVYSLDPATGAIQVVVDWHALNIDMPDLDALARLGDGSIAFSTSVLRGVRHAGGFTVLRPQNVYRFDPATGAIDPAPRFDGVRLGLTDLDGYDEYPDGRMAFSTSTDAFVHGTHVKRQNAYTLEINGALTLGFDGQSLGLRSLDDFTIPTSDHGSRTLRPSAAALTRMDSGIAATGR